MAINNIGCYLNNNNPDDIFLRNVLDKIKEKYHITSDSKAIKLAVLFFYRYGGLNMSIEDIKYSCVVKPVVQEDVVENKLQSKENIVAGPERKEDDISKAPVPAEEPAEDDLDEERLLDFLNQTGTFDMFDD